MSDINNLLQEIDEELHHQKVTAFWGKYGAAIMTAAILVILGTAAITGWNKYVLSNQQNATAQYAQILTDKNSSSAQKIEALNGFAALASKTPQSVLARLQMAGMARSEGKLDNAIEAYDALAADASVEPVFRELAVFYAVQAQMDTGDAKAMLAKIEPLVEKSAWRFAAKEYAAHLALKIGDKAKAKTYFEDLAQNKESPRGMPARARDMLRWLEGGV